MINKKAPLIFLFGAVIGFIVWSPAGVLAASLYLYPDSSTKSVGEVFPVTIQVSSVDQAINAAGGVISFPSGNLEVVSVSKDNSIFNFWLEEPTYSNTTGTVNFEGIVLNPGFSGVGGRLATINFKTKALGTASVNFLTASVLANDGQGTNILSDLGSSQVVIRLPASVPGPSQSTSPVFINGAPNAPAISSSSHPNSTQWYANNNPVFSWALPPGITTVQTSVDKFPNSIPNITSSPPISEKQVTDLADGAWYFHLRLRDNNGWGSISHFRFQIDTAKPNNLDLAEVKRSDKTEPQVAFTLRAQDETSGLSHYEIKIDNSAPQTWIDDGSHIFKTEPLPPGPHLLLVKVFDKAGNNLASSLDFSVAPLISPELIEIPYLINTNQHFIIKGQTAYPGATVKIWMEGLEEPAGFFRSLFTSDHSSLHDHTVIADSGGNFVFVHKPEPESLTYNIWAEVIDKRGARSKPSEKISIFIQPSSLMLAGSWLEKFLIIAVPIIALLALLAFSLWYFWHKFKLLQARVRREIKEADISFHQAFSSLRDSLIKQIETLDKVKLKRNLTNEEEKILKQLKEDLLAFENIASKEMKDIRDIEI